MTLRGEFIGDMDVVRNDSISHYSISPIYLYTPSINKLLWLEMILEEETFRQFGYYPNNLACYTHKKVLAQCDRCGKVRSLRFKDAADHKNCLACQWELYKSPPPVMYGKDNPNFGKPKSEETIAKIRKKLTGRKLGPHSESWCRKISESNKGKHNCTIETREKMSNAKIGKYLGENNPNWKDGASFEPYCQKFNREFKEHIRDLFNRCCFLCNKTESTNKQKLSVHHVNYNKNCGCDDDLECQFVPLCRSCHTKTIFNQEYWESFIANLLREKEMEQKNG